MMIRDSVAVFVFLNSALLDYIFIVIKSVSQEFVSYMFVYVPCYFETDKGQMTPLNMKKEIWYSSKQPTAVIPQGYFCSCQEVCGRIVECLNN